MAVSAEKEKEIRRLIGLGVSKSNIAKKLKLKESTIEKISEKAFVQTAARDISKYVAEEKYNDICRVIDVYIKELTDETKLEEAKINQLASVIGMIIDKFSKVGADADNGKIEELIGSLKK